MTADRTSPADSTPRRGFGMAGWMMRAVTGAVAVTCRAACAVRHTLARRRRKPGKPAVSRGPPRAVAPRLLYVPMWIWREIAAKEVDRWRERQTPVELS